MYISDIEDQIKAPEGRRLLALYREAARDGAAPHIRMLTSEIMREMGRDLSVVEKNEHGEFDYVYFGAALVRLTGQDFSGKSTAHQPPKSSALARRSFMQALETMSPLFSIDRATENGRVHLWGRLHLPMVDESGRVLVVTFNRPREYSDELLRDILDAAADGILAVKALRDSQGDLVDAAILAVNAPMLEILRIEQETLLATPLLSLFPDIRASGAWKRHAAVIETRECQTFEMQMAIAGVDRWYRIVSAPMGDGLVISFTDITELKQLNLELQQQRQLLTEEMAQRSLVEQELWNLAHLDPLTGAANRRSMQEKALATLTLARKNGVTCTMLALDIDFFKSINDTYGHAAGDLAIKAVAEIGRTGLRGERDVIARMGGEEFAMLLYDTSVETGIAIAERLRRQIEATRIREGEAEFGVTVSFGVSESSETCNYEELLASADGALYRAKRTGRNRTASGALAEAA